MYWFFCKGNDGPQYLTKNIFGKIEMLQKRELSQRLKKSNSALVTHGVLVSARVDEVVLQCGDDARVRADGEIVDRIPVADQRVLHLPEGWELRSKALAGNQYHFTYKPTIGHQ